MHFQSMLCQYFWEKSQCLILLPFLVPNNASPKIVLASIAR